MRLAALLLAIASSVAAQTPEELFKQRKYDDAKKVFAERVATNRNDANALFYMGRIAEEQGRHSEAVDWYEKALKLNDTSATYHFWLGSALGEQAQRANKITQPFLARRVKNAFERAVALDPTMIDPRLGLVDFYSIAPGVMGGDMDKARAQAAAVARLNPMRGHIANARIALRQKNDSVAIREYEAAIATTPDSATAYYGLAGILRSRSRWREALDVYDRLMTRLPNEPFAPANFGVVAAISGLEFERGERELRRFLASPPKEALPTTLSTVRYRLGTILEKTGRVVEARAEYNEAVRLNPKNADARKALDAKK